MNPVNQNDYLSQYFYEVYNEDIFKRYISFLIYRKKKKIKNIVKQLFENEKPSYKKVSPDLSLKNDCL